MSEIQDIDRIIDDLAAESGGYFSFPSGKKLTDSQLDHVMLIVRDIIGNK